MKENPTTMREIYGKLPDGREVGIFTLRNGVGTVARVMEYGAILVSMEVADASGVVADVVLGYDGLEGWLGDDCYFGASIGRFGNRIKDGRFSLGGRSYVLAQNNGPNHLHGGICGFDKVLWSGRVRGENEVEFRYLSKDGEEGYPGNLEVCVSYRLTEANELIWKVEARVDAETIVNVVHHSYWNLSGDAGGGILDHELQLAAGAYLPTDDWMIPSGEIAQVAGTPMDFREARTIGKRIDDGFDDLKRGGGYDHAWVLEPRDGTSFAARLRDPKSGRVMEVYTDQPAVQFYAGNFINESIVGKGGIAYRKRSGLCLETQGFPDAPNQPHFPSCVLRPGEIYRHELVHRFLAE